MWLSRLPHRADSMNLRDYMCFVSIPEVTVQAVQDFIPQLLSRMHLEFLIYGNVDRKVPYLH